jgi:HAMP domain-containing protein
MTLRSRLILGYGFLVILVLAVAGTATVGFFDLSGQIDAMTPKVEHAAAGQALEQAQHTSSRYGAAMAGLVGLALISFVFLTRALQKRLLDRLTEIREVASAVRAGDPHRRVSVQMHDELGDVGRQLNEALDRYTELERHVDGRLSEMKQDFLGLFDAFDIRGAFFNLDGGLVASTLTPEGDDLPDELEDCIVEAGRDLVDARTTDAEAVTRVTAPDGSDITVELVYARGRRLVGWLAHLEHQRSTPNP